MFCPKYENPGPARILWVFPDFPASLGRKPPAAQLYDTRIRHARTAKEIADDEQANSLAW